MATPLGFPEVRGDAARACCLALTCPGHWSVRKTVYGGDGEVARFAWSSRLVGQTHGRAVGYMYSALAGDLLVVWNDSPSRETSNPFSLSI